ncbi:hypothetical protein [Sphingomonas abietis]|uniref:Uncharacterized protein n=1 Tax=Sphingomonas abietis TaxID=3012344 RepID=A0ABY7NQF8_9SPHN|nr:hypothetical protein [Sphingomonas abietis]WBO23772.1 hypothetical protein PBT88_06520 [Sphingomonas abietis]
MSSAPLCDHLKSGFGGAARDAIEAQPGCLVGPLGWEAAMQGIDLAGKEHRLHGFAT